MTPQPSLIPQNKNNPLLSPQTEENFHSPQIKNIFEYFSQELIKTLELACQQTRKQNQRYLLPWTLLSTLTSQKNIVTKFDKSTLDTIQNKIQSTITSESSAPFSGIVFFSPEIKKILLAAYFISKQQFSTSITNEHLLLALSVYPDIQDLFSSINFSLSSSPNFRIPDTLKKYSTDLSVDSQKNIKNYQERDQELENIIRVLAKENKHHVVLLGNEGVGKSTLAFGLASYLAANKFPNFTDVRVISLDLSNLFPSTSQINFDTQKIIEEIASLGKIIFFFDKVDLLSSDIQISQLINFLQNLEKEGNVYFVLSTAPQFFKAYISENPYFSSSFETIKIEELSSDSTQEIVAAEAPRVEKRYQVKVESSVFKEVTTLSKRYLPGSMPQKAISLLEEVCASVSFKKKTDVTTEDVRDVVSKKTGIPLSSLTESETEKLKNLENLLAAHVIGQKEAIVKVSESLKRARAGLKDPRKPIGSFLFLGPTGVGKTELAKTLAKVFFNDEKAFIRFDMSEYAESHSAQRLIGSPPGYVGYEEGGQLTNQVLARPYSLILFDEIEKAHPRIFDLFLQILDDGRLTDSQGQMVDFKNTLIIFTSNIASQEIFSHGEDLTNPKFDRQEFFEETIMPLVREFLRPELINRFDDIIMFNLLGKTELLEIARLKIKQLQDRLKEKNINFEISDKKLHDLVDTSYNPSFGARSLERAIKDQIENYVAKKIISGEVKEGENITW